MRRWLGLLLILAVGCSSPAPGGLQTTSTGSAPFTSTIPPTTQATTTSPTTTTAEPGGPMVVVMPTGLPPDFEELVATVDGVSDVAVIRSGSMRLVESHDSEGTTVDLAGGGFVIPIEALIFETAGSASIFSAPLAVALSEVGDGEALLSVSSAALRRLAVGGSMTFDDGTVYRVAAIAPDSVVGTTEVILVGADPPSLPASRRRAAFVEYDGRGPALEQALLPLLGDAPYRVFDPADREPRDEQRATLAQIAVKQIFGEFAYRPQEGRQVEIDPAWTAANLVTVDLPLLGQAKCHRVFAAILTEVMQSLIDDGLEDVIDPTAFQGCWNPRFIGNSTQLSRHAWGIAADINFGNALDGDLGSPVHQELLERMGAAGVTSGHEWTIPDPGHFEFRSDAP